VSPAAPEGALEPPPTAEPLAAPPLAAAELLSLPHQVRFEGFLPIVADPDLIELRGE
jgi:hypothetical protein